MINNGKKYGLSLFEMRIIGNEAIVKVDKKTYVLNESAKEIIQIMGNYNEELDCTMIAKEMQKIHKEINFETIVTDCINALEVMLNAGILREGLTNDCQENKRSN